MQKNLVIVESPAKAKTIEKFLGKDFKVLSSYGHIRDLKKKEFSIDVEKNFKPNYEIPADKKALVSTLKAEAKEAETVWLASDEDREMCIRDSISSNTPWKIESNKNWCVPTPAMSSASSLIAEVSVIMEENPDEQERTAILTITADRIKEMCIRDRGYGMTQNPGW